MATRIADTVRSTLRDYQRRGIVHPKASELIGDFARTVVRAGTRPSRWRQLATECERQWPELLAAIERLEDAAAHPRSVGSLRAAAATFVDAGRALGRAEAFDEVTTKIARALDEATETFDAEAARPSEEAKHDPEHQPSFEAFEAWRDGRRQLWKLIETAAQTIGRQAVLERDVASKLRQAADDAIAKALRPQKGIRQRLGEALLAGVARWEADRDG